MQTSTDQQIETKWFLGTGPKEYFYTLWRSVKVSGKAYGLSTYWYYRQNLSHNYDEAVAKATSMTGQTTWEEFDISGYRRVNSGNPDLDKAPEEIVMSFGKYQGQTLAWVLDEDINYVLFLALKSDWEPSKSAQAKVINYIRAMFREEAANVETKRKERIAAERAARDAERAARDAARADLPDFGDARTTVLGKVISTKVVESQFGSSVKMLVEHEDGWKVWGTIPQAISCINQECGPYHFQRSLEKGDQVRFDARIQKSDRDAKFGFFSRATKAALVKPFEGELAPVAKGDYPKVIVPEAVAEAVSK
jgi:hypothetical protein